MLLFNFNICSKLKSSIDFNTSNVTIQHAGLLFVYMCERYFNTSNVTIQPHPLW